MTPPRDDFDRPAGPGLMIAARRWTPPAGLKLRLIVLGGVFAVAALLVAVMAMRTHSAAPAGEIPLIRAETTPYRVKPQEPGGMDIPYHDSTVFDALHAGAATAPPPEDAQDKVENLLGMPEQPLPRDKLFPAQAAQAGAATAVANAAPAKSAPAPSPDATGAAPSSSPVTPVEAMPPAMPETTAKIVAAPVAPVTVSPAAPSSPPPPAHVVKAAPPANAAPASAGQSYIQLGAVQSVDAAEKVWSGAKAANGAALAGYTLHVEKATLPRGTFYRVQAGPVSADKAHATCAALNAHKAGNCLVAKR